MNYAGIIFEKNKKFLLQLRDNKKGISSPNKWAIFGGGIEKNETPKMAVIREIKEELDFKLKKNDVVPFVKFFFPWKKYYIFKSKISPEIKHLKLREGANMKYFSRKDIIKLKNIVFFVKLFFRFYFF
jgi:8-oxo-dGTP pyrophosphatase MutT (NUDIX family)